MELPKIARLVTPKEVERARRRLVELFAEDPRRAECNCYLFYCVFQQVVCIAELLEIGHTIYTSPDPKMVLSKRALNIIQAEVPTHLDDSRHKEMLMSDLIFTLLTVPEYGLAQSLSHPYLSDVVDIEPSEREVRTWLEEYDGEIDVLTPIGYRVLKENEITRHWFPLACGRSFRNPYTDETIEHYLTEIARGAGRAVSLWKDALSVEDDQAFLLKVKASFYEMSRCDVFEDLDRIREYWAFWEARRPIS